MRLGLSAPLGAAILDVSLGGTAGPDASIWPLAFPRSRPKGPRTHQKRRGRAMSNFLQRNALIFSARIGGKSFRIIGEEHGISASRARMIFLREAYRLNPGIAPAVTKTISEPLIQETPKPAATSLSDRPPDI